MKFSSIYLVKSRTAPVVIPKIFAPKVSLTLILLTLSINVIKSFNLK